MSRPTRIGFTLVELLVVIVIISMLVGLLIPAVSGARNRARQTQCMNNQHELAVAIQQYETAKDHLPGYTNRIGTVDALTWVQVLMPYLGRNDIWEEIRKDVFTDLPQKIPQLICPTDQPEEVYALSYAVNCGQFSTGNTEPPLYGLFVKRDITTNAKPVTTSNIKDGAQNTILFSENIQATQWHTLDGPTSGGRRSPYVIDVGIMWSNPLNTASCGAINGSARVNECIEGAPGFPWGDGETDAGAKTYRLYARPSSNHPGGAVVTYADGHQDFLSDSIDVAVYLDMLDPAGP